MPAMPPRAVLSEHLEERLRGRRLLAGVFLTFQFDPAFFEQDILPVFFDIPLSHAAPVKLIQLEDALRSVPHGVSVYYDRNGIIPGAGGARLVNRISVGHPTGIFHPKNVFALVEGVEPDEAGHRARALVVASMSANLTRTGWWENVEVCHTEEVAEGDFTRLRRDLRGFLRSLARQTGDKAADGHAALRAIRQFLGETDQRETRSSGGRLHPHFYDGTEPVVDFLSSVAGRALEGMNLEVISPYFDKAASALPLSDLLERFAPKETRVFLPRNEKDEALCSEAVFHAVKALPGVSWARLPADLLKSGKAEAARSRSVHAKVYRFFQSSPKREVLFVGSVNLTSAAHRRGGNLETGFLVEPDLTHRPDWWLIAESPRPAGFEHRSEAEGTATSGGTSLSLRFWWNTDIAEAYWDAQTSSPELTVMWQKVPLFTVRPLGPRSWVRLGASEAAELGRVLKSTSILEVRGDGKDDGFVLVQEEGMHARPSLLFDLSPAEILRYWSLLTQAQRAEFLNARAPELALTDEGAQLLAQAARFVPDETFFDRFAGIFLAFGCLERSVRQALPDNTREAAYRLFGKKHDSLPNLLRKVTEQAATGEGDPTEHFVTLLCARQLVNEIRRSHPDFFRDHPSEAVGLNEQVGEAEALRARLIAHDPERMPEFLDWFEQWFVKRATPVAVEEP